MEERGEVEKGEEESEREEGRERQERWERRREKERGGGGEERRGERRRRGIRDAFHCCSGYHVVLALSQDLFNNYDCDCVMGWEDKNCDVETNECINMPCMNGATCNVSHNHLELQRIQTGL